MHRARRVVLAYLLFALPLLPSIASATDLSADVGVAAAVPMGAGPSFLGSAATFGIAWPPRARARSDGTVGGRDAGRVAR